MDDQARDRDDTEVRTRPDDDGSDRGRGSADDTDRSQTTSETDDEDAGSSEASSDGYGEEQRVSAEEFAREHDPEQHDTAAGEDARQPGDWTADRAGGPQVWDADGNLVEGAGPGAPMGGQEQSDEGDRG